jgi:hypothetical protein
MRLPHGSERAAGDPGNQRQPSDYARTSPEARQGFAVFAVRLVLVIMAREHMGGRGPASTAFGRKIGFNEVEQHVVVTQ